MAGVPFARQPVKVEVLNDLNQRVVNWLRVVRDCPEDFGSLVEKTPISRIEYQWALTAMDDESLPPLRRALTFHAAVDQSIPVPIPPARLVGDVHIRLTLELGATIARMKSSGLGIV